MTAAQQRAARNRKPLPPATGTVGWICQLTTGPNAHPGVLTLNGTTYLVHAHATGFQLVKADDGTVYDLPTDLSGCDCPDAAYRQERSAGQCKHARGLRAALLALGYDLPASTHPAA